MSSGVNGGFDGFGFNVVSSSATGVTDNIGMFGDTYSLIPPSTTATAEGNYDGGSLIQSLDTLEMSSSYLNGPVSSYQFDGAFEGGVFGVEAVSGPVAPQQSGDGLGMQQQSQQSFEKSLITLNDISNYRASGLDWMETGVSNWLSFDQGASFGVTEMVPPSTTPSVSTSSMYNFYDDDEDECQKELDTLMEATEEDFRSQVGNCPVGGVGGEVTTTANGGSQESDEDDEDDDDEEEEDEEDSSDQSADENNVCVAKKSKVDKPATQRQFRSESCTQCHLEFSTPGQFEKHMKTVHQEDHPYPCPSCEKKFAKWYQCIAHQKIHDPDRYKGEPEWECGLCDKKYHVRVSLYAHYKTTHPGQKPGRRKNSEVEVTQGGRRKKLEKQTPGADVTKSLKKLNKLKRRKSTNQAEPQSPAPITPEKEVKVEFLPPPTPPPLPPPEFPELSEDCRPGHYPCTVCGKVFTVPFNLRHHLLLHTGEKPHKCPYCEERFRLKQTLNYHLQRRHRTKQDTRNILKLHKCRVCGQDDFYMFHELHSHRTRKHHNVPYDKEKEKTFGCGICLKPYFLREDAIVCALLGHDPTKLRETMFQYTCPGCPKNSLGFYKLAYLRNHWDAEHPEKELPSKLKKASNFDEITLGLKWDSLPIYRINKYKAQDIREHGIPRGTSFECPLYFDLTKFGPSREEQHWMASLMLDILADLRVTPDGPQICTLCGEELSKKGNLKRHLTSVHISQEMLQQEQEEKELEGPEEEERRKHVRPEKVPEEEVEDIFKAVICKKKKMKVKVEESESSGEEEEEEENVGGNVQEATSFQCKFCDKTFPKKRALLFHEVRGHINPKKKEPVKNNTRTKARTPRAPVKRKRPPTPIPSESEEDSSSEEEIKEEIESSSEEEQKEIRVPGRVNVLDTKAVNALLNFKTLRVLLSRTAFKKKLPPEVVEEVKAEPEVEVEEVMEEEEEMEEAEVEQEEADPEEEEEEMMEEEEELEQELLIEFPCESQLLKREVKTDWVDPLAIDDDNVGGEMQEVDCRPKKISTPPHRIVTRRRSSVLAERKPPQQQQQLHKNLVIKKTPKIMLCRIELQQNGIS